jgi:hypothetical protein
VDVLLKQVALSGTPSMAAVLASFSVAFVLMLALQLWRHVSGRSRLAWRNLGAGALLGLLNGGNIPSMCTRISRCRTARPPCSPA